MVLLTNAELLLEAGQDVFARAVVKEPSAALLGAYRFLTRQQVKYCMNSVPSVIFRALAENNVDEGNFPHQPIDMRLFWYNVQTFPEEAVIHASRILASTRVDTALTASDTQVNGYTMWNVMDTQPNPLGLPRVTMLDEVVVFACASRSTALARIILSRVDNPMLTASQWEAVEERVGTADVG